jgi:hypothetical protein
MRIPAAGAAHALRRRYDLSLVDVPDLVAEVGCCVAGVRKAFMRSLGWRMPE